MFSIEQIRISAKIVLDGTKNPNLVSDKESARLNSAVSTMVEKSPVTLREAVFGDSEPISDQKWREILAEEPFWAKMQAILEG